MWDIVVLALLSLPIEVPVPRNVPEPVWDTLKRVSLAIEIVGPHERWRSDFQAEFSYVHTHWRELAEAPPLADSYRFPPAYVAAEYCRFNTTYQEYLRSRRWLFHHHQDAYSLCLKESKYLALIWTAVYGSVDRSSSFVSQRRYLTRLRELLGLEAYYAGDLPPPVPLWWFDWYEGQ